jgi:hypothetical protein
MHKHDCRQPLFDTTGPRTVKLGLRDSKMVQNGECIVLTRTSAHQMPTCRETLIRGRREKNKSRANNRRRRENRYARQSPNPIGHRRRSVNKKLDLRQDPINAMHTLYNTEETVQPHPRGHSQPPRRHKHPLPDEEQIPENQLHPISTVCNHEE